MRVDILAIGSQGDVQPCVALGMGLQRAGHRVRVVTLGGFEDLVRSRGLEHLVIGESPQDVANTDAGRVWIQNRASVLGFVRGFVQVANSLIEDGIRSYWRACQDAEHDTEMVIVSAMGLPVGSHIAEKLRVPLLQAQLAPPVVPTRYDADGRRNLATALRGRFSALIHAAFHFVVWSQLRRTTNEARRRILDLPSLSLTEPLRATARKPVRLLGAYSPAVVFRPPDWPDSIDVTGYWFLDDLPGWTPPDDLVDFVESGSPPVYVGFGSTPFPQPDVTTKLVVRALARAGRRGVLVAGGSGLATGRLSDDVLSLNFVPHSWLLPKMSAAVHHGGAGVTGAALRAGLPSVVVPVFADQPFWSERVFKLGVGPRPIPALRLTEDALADAIRATAGSEMICRAAALGERIRSEKGVARAVEIIHQHFERGVVDEVKHQHAH
jgi:sterol 3beta-glucosyltransferase